MASQQPQASTSAADEPPQRVTKFWCQFSVDRALEILSLGPNFTAADVRKAYKRRILVDHPDKHPDPVKKAKQVKVTEDLNHAVEMLMNLLNNVPMSNVTRKRHSVTMNMMAEGLKRAFKAMYGGGQPMTLDDDDNSADADFYQTLYQQSLRKKGRPKKPPAHPIEKFYPHRSPAIEKSKGVFVFKCPECDKELTRFGAVNHHLEKVHFINPIYGEDVKGVHARTWKVKKLTLKKIAGSEFRVHVANEPQQGFGSTSKAIKSVIHKNHKRPKTCLEPVTIRLSRHEPDGLAAAPEPFGIRQDVSPPEPAGIPPMP